MNYLGSIMYLSIMPYLQITRMIETQLSDFLRGEA